MHEIKRAVVAISAVAWYSPQAVTTRAACLTAAAAIAVTLDLRVLWSVRVMKGPASRSEIMEK